MHDLLKERFGGQLAAASATGSDLDDGWQVVRRVGSHGQAVVSPGGQRRFITSTAPLSARDFDGDLAALDLSLRRAAGGWRPAVAAADVVLPDYLSDGLRMLDGRVALRLGHSGSAVRVEGRDAVVYPDAVPGGDADFIATPTASGVETFVQVRSPQAAESTTLRFELPAGAGLVESRDGGASIVQDDKAIASVLPPNGLDAQGRAVAVSMRVEGDALVLSYSHRQEDLAYPLLIDPVIVESSIDDTVTWTAGATSPWMFSWGRDSYYGLWLSKSEGWQGERNYAQWLYRVPHSNGATTTARIASFQATRQLGEAYGDYEQSPYLVNGILKPNTNGGQWAASWSTHIGSSFDGDGPLLQVSGDPLSAANADAKEAIVALDHRDAGDRYSPSYTYLGGANVAITDPEGATVDPITSPTGYHGPTPLSVPVTARDPGLGVYSYTMFRDTPNGQTFVANYSPQPGNSDYCDGRAKLPCPQTASHNFAIDPQNSALSEGTNNLRVCAYDLLANIPNTCAPFNLNIDRTAPATPSGFAVAYDPSDSDAMVYWDDSDTMANGTPGSGVASRRARYKRSSDAGWSAWFDVTAAQLQVPNTAPTDTVSVEASSYDAAGNASATGSASGLSLTDDDDSPDGVVAGDTTFSASDEDNYGTEACEARYGSGSGYCILPDGFGDDPSAATSSRTALGAAPSSSAFAYGIADENADNEKGFATLPFINGANFQALNVTRVRRIVPWDIAQRDPSTPTGFKYPERWKAFKRFYDEATMPSQPGTRAQDLMVSFEFGCAPVGDKAPDEAVPCARATRNDSGNEAPPTSQAYMAAVRQFHKDFPRVRWMSAWNEPNGEAQPTRRKNPSYAYDGAKRAAYYAYVLERYVCAPFRRKAPGNRCDVVAGDFAPGTENVAFSVAAEVKYERIYIKRLYDLIDGIPSNIEMIRQPSHYGYHPYRDVNMQYSNVNDSGTHRLLKLLAAYHGANTRLWFSEVGGRVGNAKPGGGINTVADQQRQVDYLLSRLVNQPRVDRLYLYNFCPGDPRKFDSALFDPAPAGSAVPRTCDDGASQRPAYTTYKDATS